MREYTQEELIRHLHIAKGTDLVFMLGAGCSIESGCMPANKLVLEFKKRIYCAQHGLKLNDNSLINDEAFVKEVDKELPSNMANPYSYYFEKCFPNSLDRSKFIKENFQNISPSYGYYCFANYLIKNSIKIVLTTNFDSLVEKAVKKLDENYDIAFVSDAITPTLNNKLTVFKLHGDYNYDKLRNTEEELSTLSFKINSLASSIQCKEIIVMGYSGMDNSIMQLLDDLSKKGITIIWCILKEYHTKNEKIEALFMQNNDSGYCYISGFDDLFSKEYVYSDCSNKIINEVYKTQENDKLELIVENQPEMMKFNANALINNPICYKYKITIDGNLIKRFNNENSNSFLLEYKGFIYIVGDISNIKTLLQIAPEQLKSISICGEDIPFNYKCILIKELVKIYSKINGFSVFGDNIYNNKQTEVIKEGLKIAIDLIDNKICLLTSVNYFVLCDEVSEKIKHQINAKKSNLYAASNYNKREQLLNMLFGNKLEFKIFNTLVKFDDTPINNLNNSQFNIYNCAQEPKMSVDNNYSTNQIKLVNDYGPRTTFYSTDNIKIGVFCASNDMPKLKSYLNLLINGTKSKQNIGSVIPEYKGFSNTFKKAIEIGYDWLPGFNSMNISHKEGMNLKSFADFCLRGIKKLYNEKNVDIVLVYIPNNFDCFKQENNLDLHNLIKLKCTNKYKTQFLEEKTIDSTDDINKKVFNLAMGIFTKTIGMPWYPKQYSKNTLFLGMSFGIDSNGVVVGCSQMFDGAGRGMKLIVSEVSDKHKKNQYLSSDEAYNLGKKIRATYYKTSKIEELKRIVIHRCNSFKKEEIEGFKKAFMGIDNFDLIQISDYTQFNCYCFKYNKCYGYPIKRGTTIKSSKKTAYIWTDGSVNDCDILNGSTYRNNKRGMGKPLKITKFYGTTSLNVIANDLMYLTKMDFNSSDVIYSKYPVTTKYSQIVCDLLKQGSLDDDLISFEYIM